MTDEKALALRLADALNRWHDGRIVDEAAAELRRLHEVEQQRDDLLAALKLAQSIIGHPDDAHSRLIAAAIAKAEEAK